MSGAAKAASVGPPMIFIVLDLGKK